jgi:hypothetical protein
MLAERRRLAARSAPLAAALLVAAVPLAGCGKKEEKNVRTTVEAFYGAVAAKQGAKACPRLAPEARARLERGGKRCEDVIVQAVGFDTRAGVGTIAIRNETATASVNAATQQTVVQLRKVGEAWRITKF